MSLMVVFAIIGAVWPENDSLLCMQDDIDLWTFVDDGVCTASNVAWLTTATIFVLMMTPGLSFFYGGMVGKKNVISTILQSFIAMGVISVMWVVFGFSLSFGDDVAGLGLIGDPTQFFMFQHAGLRGICGRSPHGDYHSTGSVCYFPDEVCHHHAFAHHRFVCREG